MEVRSIKILLKLLGKEKYSGKIGDIKPDDKTTISQTTSYCRDLLQENLVSLNEKKVKIKITKLGEKIANDTALMNSYDKQELKIFKNCQAKEILVSKINISPAKKRDELIAHLTEKNFIAITETKILDVTLTQKALDFLAQHLLFIGNGNLTLPKSLLNNYLNFIRDYLTQQKIATKEDKPLDNKTNKPDKQDILQTIINIDKEINSGNYLPIFYLRNYYKNILQREELDNFLYDLENEGKISLSTLIDTLKYTQEECEAGIRQSIGGALFYITIEN